MIWHFFTLTLQLISPCWLDFGVHVCRMLLLLALCLCGFELASEIPLKVGRSRDGAT